jgi:FkbM family methyltransferase
MFRSLIERASRNRVLKRHLPAAFGSRAIYVSPDASLQFWKHDLSALAPELFRLADQLVKPGDVVWDVGANVGLFAFAAAARAGNSGSVLAIEPDPWLGALLRRSMAEEAPNAAPVKVLRTAVSDRVGIVEFNVAKRARASNFITGFGGTQAGGSRRSFPVMAVSLDELGKHLPAPSLIKIDVEGMEHLVLAGAQQVLTHRPIVISEISQRERVEEVSGLLNGYRFLDTDLKPITGAFPFNIVALPG